MKLKAQKDERMTEWMNTEKLINSVTERLTVQVTKPKRAAVALDWLADPNKE